MSTKIYSGIRFKTRRFEDIHQLTMRWRARIRELTREATEKFYAEIAVLVVDGAAMGSPYRGHVLGEDQDYGNANPMSVAWDQLMTRQRKVETTRFRDPAIDFDFNVMIFSLKGHFYGMVFSDRRDWVSEFMEDPLVEEFGYWDNTDRPDHLGEKAWQRRENIWTAIMKQGGDIPAASGVSADLKSFENYWPKREAVAKRIPKYDERVRRVAARHVERGYYTFVKAIDVDRPFSSMTEHGKWLKTDAGQAAYAAAEAYVRSILPRRITAKMLRPDPPVQSLAKKEEAA